MNSTPEPIMSAEARRLEAERTAHPDGYTVGDFVDDMLCDDSVMTGENVYEYLNRLCASADRPVDELIIKIPRRLDMDHRSRDVDPGILEAIGLGAVVAH